MTTAVILIVLVLLVAAALAAFLVNRRKQEREALRERFGPEYDRAVEERGDRREAEHHLSDVARAGTRPRSATCGPRSGSATRAGGPTCRPPSSTTRSGDPGRRRPGRRGHAGPRLPAGRRRGPGRPGGHRPRRAGRPLPRRARGRQPRRRRRPPRSCARRSCTTGRCSSSCSPSRPAGTRARMPTGGHRPDRPRANPADPAGLTRTYPGRVRPLVVGFDLDMTLIDTRPGIAAVWDALSAETGVADRLRRRRGRLGPPLDEELARLVPGRADRRRRRPVPRALPVAGGRAGRRPSPGRARRSRPYAGTAAASWSSPASTSPTPGCTSSTSASTSTTLVGWLWGAGKADALREHGATVYVGDHVGDVEGARAAGALASRVPTGPVSARRAARGRRRRRPRRPHRVPGLAGRLRARPPAGRPATTHLRALGSVLVAFSGGADSAFLLAAAVRALGRRERRRPRPRSAPACRRPSSTRPRAVRRRPRVRHLMPETDEMAREGYRANAGDRCYFCKAELLDVLGPLAAELGIAARRHRHQRRRRPRRLPARHPGRRRAGRGHPAARRRADQGAGAGGQPAPGAWSPGTSRPPPACPAGSRSALEITPARLARVERAEAAVRAALAGAGDRGARPAGAGPRRPGPRRGRPRRPWQPWPRQRARARRGADGGLRRGRGRPARLPVRRDERAARPTRRATADTGGSPRAPRAILDGRAPRAPS